MEMGIIMAIDRESEQALCEEPEAMVDWSSLTMEGVKYVDCYTSQELSPDEVYQGREKEMQNAVGFEVYEWVEVEGWMRPFDTTWLDH